MSAANPRISYCEHVPVIYTPDSVTAKRKSLQLVACASLLLLAAGCGGFSASRTVSPATFLLPGLLKADPPPAPADPVLPERTPAQQIASVR
jgi:hypothetical protein